MKVMALVILLFLYAELNIARMYLVGTGPKSGGNTTVIWFAELKGLLVGFSST